MIETPEIWMQANGLKHVYLVSNLGHLTKVAGWDTNATNAQSPTDVKDAFNYLPVVYDTQSNSLGWFVDTVCENNVFVSRSSLMEAFLDAGYPVQMDTSGDESAKRMFRLRDGMIGPAS